LPQNSKELVRGIFEGKNTGIPFIPWICSFAARLEQVPVKTMLSDAGVLSRSLINARELFGYDAIVNIFDTALEAEACGCELSWQDDAPPTVTGHPLNEGKNIRELDTADIQNKGRIPVVLETTRRLKIIKGKEVAIAAAVTGPLSLAGHLKGETFMEAINRGDEEAGELVEETGSICLNLCRAYCELGVDIIVIVEEKLGDLNPESIYALDSPLRSIWNVLKYYGINSILLGRGCGENHAAPVFDLGADGVSLSGDIDYLQIKEKAAGRKLCFGFDIPNSIFLDTGTKVEIDIPEKDTGLFLTTEWEIPYAADVNKMHELMKSVREYRGF
jgi:uroporphyrinogen decarboxylase